ncbi:SGNH/GDSL hydrolase family protein [Aestuariibius sp. HNIBRBA575]|uniref:SGNH/GDSL hydrolase family protein n=1 Tax=Aestuariibius sp. HNIBRBA575 TaxID=3233343 RepID=UPI0034A41D2A
MKIPTFLSKPPLAPILIWQGLTVRRHALLLAEPIGPRKGTTRSQISTDTHLRLLIIGDSSAAGVGVDHQEDALLGQLIARLSQSMHVTWQLEAKTGATTPSTLQHLQHLDPDHFDVALIVLGVNDVTRNASLRPWIAQQNRLRALLRAKFGVQHILVNDLPPMGRFPLLPTPLRQILGQDAARLGRALAANVAKEPDVTFVPITVPYAPKYIAKDGFHPSKAAYDLWADMLAPQITTKNGQT